MHPFHKFVATNMDKFTKMCLILSLLLTSIVVPLVEARTLAQTKPNNSNNNSSYHPQNFFGFGGMVGLLPFPRFPGIGFLPVIPAGEAKKSGVKKP